MTTPGEPGFGEVPMPDGNLGNTPPPYGAQPYGQPAPAYPQPAYPQRYGQQAYPPPGYPGYPPPGYPPYGYPQPTQGTNGFAIASLVLGCLIWIEGFTGILAVVFGHVALSQIKKTNQGGRGLAIAGLVLGYIGIAFLLVIIILFVAIANSGPWG